MALLAARGRHKGDLPSHFLHDIPRASAGTAEAPYTISCPNRFYTAIHYVRIPFRSRSAETHIQERFGQAATIVTKSLNSICPTRSLNQITAIGIMRFISESSDCDAFPSRNPATSSDRGLQQLTSGGRRCPHLQMGNLVM